MSDIRIIWNPATAAGDFQMAGSGLELGHDLETAVLISLFTDARADPDDLMPDSQRADPRGWWADDIGSKLWQIFWRQVNQDTVNWARGECTRALQWLLDDGVAASVDVAARIAGKGRIGVSITITEPNGKASIYRYAWQQEG
jgi:phage gp46-like protein